MATNFVVVIRTFNRPRHLLRLLDDIERANAPGRLKVAVFDDHSTARPLRAEARCRARGWHYERLDRNHGKREAWKVFDGMFRHLKGTMRRSELCVFLDDDMRLCDNFFPRLEHVWKRIRDNQKVALHVMVDESRLAGPCWTGFSPRDVNDHVRLTQWVEGAFVANAEFFRRLHWRMEPVPPERWSRDPAISSGVGAQISKRIVGAGKRIYQVRASLVAHAGTESRMNEDREGHTLSTAHFIDGDEARDRLVDEPFERIEASLASIPERERPLRAVLEALRPQVDALRVYLNNYRIVPSWVRKIADDVATSQQHGDRGDAGKFFWCEQAKGIQLTVDDDIAYPRFYALSMAEAVEFYERRAAVGVHGVRLREPMVSYYADRTALHFTHALDEDEPVHLVGTGCLAYHADALEVQREHFELPNMADVWFGLQCQRQGVPVRAVQRPEGWLRPLPSTGPAIYDRYRRDDQAQTQAVRRRWPWRLH